MTSWNKHLRIAILALLAAFAAGFGGWFLANSGAPSDLEPPPLAVKNVSTTVVQAAASDSPASGAAAPAAVDPQRQAALDARLAEASDYAVFLTALRETFAADYQEAVAAAIEQNLDLADDGADRFVALAVQTLRQNRGLLGAKAGGDALDQLFAAHRAMLKALAGSDAGLCVDFLNGAPADKFAAFSANHRALTAAEALAGLQAIADGAQRKIDREAPETRDFDELEAKMRALGMDSAGVALLLDGKTSDPPLPDDKQCQNGLLYLDALQSMPELIRLRFYALALEVMARE